MSLRALPLFVLSLLVAVAPGCLDESEVQADPTSGEQPSDPVSVTEEGLTTNCAASILRYQANGNISNPAGTYAQKLCTSSFTMSVGDRHFAKMVGATSSGVADLWIERSVSGTWTKVRTSAVSGTSTEISDWSVDVAGTYRVCGYAQQSGSDYIRITSDRSSAAHCGAAKGCTGEATCNAGTPSADYCFGASSANCNQCSTRANATQDCPVSVGSNMHDTCCAHNPLGSNCNGAACNPGTSGTNCGWISDCSAEWNHAQNDALASRRWTTNFDPTIPYYRPLSAADQSGDAAYFYSSNKDLSKPCGAAGSACTENYTVNVAGTATTYKHSYKAPAGQGIWDTDAVNGWCASGSYGASNWSLQGNYRVCN